MDSPEINFCLTLSEVEFLNHWLKWTTIELPRSFFLLVAGFKEISRILPKFNASKVCEIISSVTLAYAKWTKKLGWLAWTKSRLMLDIL